MRHPVLPRVSSLLAFGVLLLFQAVPAQSADTPPTASARPASTPGKRAVELVRNVDMLFVVDNSSSMGAEQARLTLAFESFVFDLEKAAGSLPSLHIGVVSTNVGITPFTISGCAGNGDEGRLQSVPRSLGCVPPSGSFIVDAESRDGTRVRNYSDTLANTFACIAPLGTGGCGFEQPLESLKRALDGSICENAGFLRPDARLVLVILSNEDDCSAQDPEVFDPSPELDNLTSPLGPFGSFRCTEFGVQCDGAPIRREAASYEVCEPRGDSFLRHPSFYVDFLNSLKPEGVLAAMPMGPPSPFSVRLDSATGEPDLEPSCASALGSADPAVRLDYFMRQFGEEGVESSICSGDFSPALSSLSKLIAREVNAPCIGDRILEVDVDHQEPGLQPTCEVFDLVGSSSTSVARCSMLEDDLPDPASPKPCWWVARDPMVCSATPTQLRLHVERAGPPPAGSKLAAECVVPGPPANKEAACGDGTCDPDIGEDSTSCPTDCKPCPGCGDGVCDVGLHETCATCEIDCGPCPGGCGDGVCDVGLGETCGTCEIDCGRCPSACGDGVCDRQSETCDTCPADCGRC